MKPRLPLLGIAWVLALALGATAAIPESDARPRSSPSPTSASKANASKGRADKSGASKSARGKEKAPKGKPTDGKSAATKAGSGKQVKAKPGDGKRPKGASADSESKPLTKAEKLKLAKALAALRKTCAGKKAAKTKACRVLAEQQAEQVQEAAAAKMEKRCSTPAARKTAECKAFRGKSAKGSADACGRRYGRAKKNELVARFAKRFGTTEAAVRKFNDLADKTKKLKGGAKYLVAKSPHDGVVLTGGVLLSEEPGVLKLRRPQLAFGKPLLVQTIRAAAAAVQATSPLGVSIMVGDLSKDGGGCLPPHKSHRGGLDADIGFYFRGAYEPKVLADATAQTMDADRTWQFLRALLATGRLQYAFIHYDLQPMLLEAALRAGETADSAAKLIQYPRPIDQAHATPIRHLSGHDDHMHVRFHCGEDSCELPASAQVAIAALRLETLGGPGHERRGQGLNRPRGQIASRRAISAMY